MRIHAGRGRVCGGRVAVRDRPGCGSGSSVLLGNAAGTASPIRGEWGGIRPYGGRQLCGFCVGSAVLAVAAHADKRPKRVNKAHLQDKTSPCQMAISVFSRRLSSLPPAPRYVVIPTPAPLGSLSLAQQLLSSNLHFSPVPVTSAATALKQTRIRAQKACDLPSIL
ncbi:hypothetical protein WISP_108574 [Willisornis vidua]|uniref:Uncharacterized protein n=1 Tax=Willisornis vidua TaxID=1566151 RepID=A0ABQ9CW46_9PASS|nr:hypothetical protein WISP_108574 [Willisornis vidua]